MLKILKWDKLIIRRKKKAKTEEKIIQIRCNIKSLIWRIDNLAKIRDWITDLINRALSYLSNSA